MNDWIFVKIRNAISIPITQSTSQFPIRNGDHLPRNEIQCRTCFFVHLVLIQDKRSFKRRRCSSPINCSELLTLCNPWIRFNRFLYFQIDGITVYIVHVHRTFVWNSSLKTVDSFDLLSFNWKSIRKNNIQTNLHFANNSIHQSDDFNFISTKNRNKS